MDSDKIRQDPLQQIPVEISALIFETFHESYPEIVDRFTSPFELGQICRNWREIAWSTPKIWTSVVVSLNENREMNYSIELLNEYIVRSSNLPLDFCTIWHGDDDPMVDDVFLPIVKVLSSCAFRLYSVSLSLPIGALSLLSRWFPTGLSPVLRHLNLYPVDTFSPAAVNPGEVDFTSITGMLRSFQLGKNDNGVWLDHVQIATSNLESITATGSINCWMQFLRSSPCLEIANITIFENSEDATIDSDPVFTHQSIKKLCLTAFTTEASHLILTHFVWPNLESVSITVPAHQTIDDIVGPLPNDFFLLLLNSGHNLRKTHLDYMIWDHKELAQAFADISLQELRELSFYCPLDTSAPEIAEVIFGQHVGPHFPKLELFEITHATPCRDDTWDFLHAIEQHSKNHVMQSNSHNSAGQAQNSDMQVSRLHLVKIQFVLADLRKIFNYNSLLSTKDLEAIERLEERGTRLKILAAGIVRALEPIDLVQRFISLQ